MRQNERRTKKRPDGSMALHPLQRDLLRAIHESDAARERWRRSTMVLIEQSRIEAAARLGQDARSSNAITHAILGYLGSLPMFRGDALCAMSRLDPSGGLAVARQIAASIERTRGEPLSVCSDDDWRQWIEHDLSPRGRGESERAQN